MEIKEAKDLLKLKWRNLTDKELDNFWIEQFIKYRFCTEEHIDKFIEKLIKYISLEFELPFIDVLSIIKLENIAFFVKKRDIFMCSTSISVYDYLKIRKLLSYFKIPETPHIDKFLAVYKGSLSKVTKEF